MSQDRAESGVHRAALHSLATLERAAWAADDPDRVELLARVVAGLHGLEPLARPSGLGPSTWTTEQALAWRERDDLDERTRSSLAFAERFSLDVGAITDDDRAAFGAAVGAATGDVVFLLYVLDLGARVAAAADALLDGGLALPSADEAADESLWVCIDRFLTTVAVADRLDVVTAELVRLRGARQHRCRMCASLRNRSALLEGADDTMFDAVDTYADGTLSERHRAALALVDAMIWTPAHVPEQVVTEVRAHFDANERLELVLDVMRNAANKIAVSLAADAANVTEGYEIYDIGPDGNPVYGLTLS